MEAGFDAAGGDRGELVKLYDAIHVDVAAGKGAKAAWKEADEAEFREQMRDRYGFDLGKIPPQERTNAMRAWAGAPGHVEGDTTGVVQPTAGVGSRVIALDRGNVGTVTNVHDNNMVDVHFVNREEGTQATRRFSWDQLRVINPARRTATAPQSQAQQHVEQHVLDAVAEQNVTSFLDGEAGNDRHEITDFYTDIQAQIGAGDYPEFYSAQETQLQRQLDQRYNLDLDQVAPEDRADWLRAWANAEKGHATQDYDSADADRAAAEHAASDAEAAHADATDAQAAGEPEAAAQSDARAAADTDRAGELADDASQSYDSAERRTQLAADLENAVGGDVAGQRAAADACQATPPSASTSNPQGRMRRAGRKVAKTIRRIPHTRIDR